MQFKEPKDFYEYMKKLKEVTEKNKKELSKISDDVLLSVSKFIAKTISVNFQLLKLDKITVGTLLQMFIDSYNALLSQMGSSWFTSRVFDMVIAIMREQGVLEIFEEGEKNASDN